MGDVPAEPSENILPGVLPVAGVVRLPVALAVVQDTQDVLRGIVRVDDGDVHLEPRAPNTVMGGVLGGAHVCGGDDSESAVLRELAEGAYEQVQADCLMKDTMMSMLSDSLILVLSSSVRTTGLPRVIAMLRSSLTVGPDSLLGSEAHGSHPSFVRQ